MHRNLLFTLIGAILILGCQGPAKDEVLSIKKAGGLIDESEILSAGTVTIIRNTSENLVNCETQNQVILSIDQNPNLPLYCQDFSSLDSTYEPGLVCVGGVDISPITVNPQEYLCASSIETNQIRVCGRSPSRIRKVVEASSAADLETYEVTFDSLPWGCRVNISYSTKTSNSFSQSANSQSTIIIPPPCGLSNSCSAPASTGIWGPWGDLTSCSEKCGLGTKEQRRTCSGGSCLGDDAGTGVQEQVVTCKGTDCSGLTPVHGGWSEYKKLTSCSSCDGTYIEIKYCNNPKPLNGGNWCSDVAFGTETVSRTLPCPSCEPTNYSCMGGHLISPDRETLCMAGNKGVQLPVGSVVVVTRSSGSGYCPLSAKCTLGTFGAFWLFNK